MGPWAVTADEVGDLDALEVSASVNGEPRQERPEVVTRALLEFLRGL
jgi:hypothetical protein